MSLRITMQECQVTRDNPIIRTRVPMGLLEDGGMVAQAVRAMRLSPGDRVLVQSMSHERTELLHEAEFVVVSAVTSMKKVTKDDMSEQSVEQTDYKVVRKDDWWDAKTGSYVGELVAEEGGEIPVRRRPGRPPKEAKAA